MGLPMLTVAIKRYTHSANRGFAFGLFYSVMNIAAFASGILVDAITLGTHLLYIDLYKYARLRIYRHCRPWR
jgi:hypothetical protein